MAHLAKAKAHIQARPVGTTAAVVAAVTVILNLLGVAITPDAVAAIVGGVAAVVSWFTPRK